MIGTEDQDWTHRRRVQERREFTGMDTVALMKWRIVGICWGYCRVYFAEEDCVGVGGLGSRESHMNKILKLIRDKRRIMSSLHFKYCPLLIAQIVEQTGQIEHDVRYLCKRDHVDADNHKRVRFQDHINQCNTNHDHDEGNKDDGYNDVGVGYRCSSRFEIEG